MSSTEITTTTVITTRAERALDSTIQINGETLPVYWGGTMVPYAMAYLKPRHVRALGHQPRKGKRYAIRAGNELVTLHGEYTATIAALALPGLHINQGPLMSTTVLATR